MSEPLPEESAREIRSALAAGNKIEAIRLYREFSGVGLAEAKAFIEQLAPDAPAGKSAAGDEDARIREALFAGNKIAAIKLHREMAGCGLAEAKEHIDRVESQLRISSAERFARPAGKGCAVSSLALAATIAALVRLFR